MQSFSLLWSQLPKEGMSTVFCSGLQNPPFKRQQGRLLLFQLRTATIRRSPTKTFQVQRKYKNKEFRQTVLKEEKHTETQETTATSLKCSFASTISTFPHLKLPWCWFNIENILNIFQTLLWLSSSHKVFSVLVTVLFSFISNSSEAQIISCKFFSRPSNSVALTICYLRNRN